MVRFVRLSVVLVAAGACAQTPASAGSNQRSEEFARLPYSLIGAWVPYSEAYVRLGDLVIGTDALSWDTCSRAAYRVIRSEGSTTLIQLLRSPPCKLFGEANFMVLNRVDRALEITICHEQPELARPLANGHCSSQGTLYMQEH